MQGHSLHGGEVIQSRTRVVCGSMNVIHLLIPVFAWCKCLSPKIWLVKICNFLNRCSLKLFATEFYPRKDRVVDGIEIWIVNGSQEANLWMTLSFCYLKAQDSK